MFCPHSLSAVHTGADATHSTAYWAASPPHARALAAGALLSRAGGGRLDLLAQASGRAECLAAGAVVQIVFRRERDVHTVKVLWGTACFGDVC